MKKRSIQEERDTDDEKEQDKQKGFGEDSE